jgi:membrane AbrB-like protein
LFFKWLVLIGSSTLITLGLDYFGLPASRFMGPLGAGIILALYKVPLTIHPLLYPLAQGLIGLLVASSLKPSTYGALAASWPIMALGVVWTLASAMVLGLVLRRFKVLPESTALWSLAPGTAGVITIMSGEFGADQRLVAFTQYLRVLIVSLVAVGVARQFIGQTTDAQGVDLFPPLNGLDFLSLWACLFFGLILTKISRLPGGLIFWPLILGFAAENFLALNVAPPPWLMVLAYAVMGWKVGLTFDRDAVVKSVKTLPAALLAILVLIASCGLFAVGMVFLGDFDPLTAYLASSPGGLDAVTIIASSSGADLPLVMAMQACRLLLVVVATPSLARFLRAK